MYIFSLQLDVKKCKFPPSSTNTSRTPNTRPNSKPGTAGQLCVSTGIPHRTTASPHARGWLTKRGEFAMRLPSVIQSRYNEADRISQLLRHAGPHRVYFNYNLIMASCSASNPRFQSSSLRTTHPTTQYATMYQSLHTFNASTDPYHFVMIPHALLLQNINRVGIEQ